MSVRVSPSRAATGRVARRTETLAEIRARAREVIAQRGPDGLSLRSVGAEMGMAPSGVHYYYASRDELLGAVIVEVFHDLAAEVSHATDNLEQVAAWLAGVLAYSRWACSNHELWLLAHSRTATALKSSPALLPAKDAAVRALMSPLREVLDAMEECPVDSALVKHLSDWARAIGEQPAPWRQLMEVHLYTLVHGHVHLAVTGSLPRELLRDASLLEAQLLTALRSLGVRPYLT